MPEAALDTLQFDRFRRDDRVGAWLFRLQGHPTSKPHDHLFHEIVVVEAGAATHCAAEGDHPLKPGDVIVIRPQTWHCYKDTRDLDIVNCLIDSRLFAQFGSLLSQVDGAFELYRKRTARRERDAPTILHASPTDRHAINVLLEKIMHEQDHAQTGWQASVTANVLELLVQVARLGADTPQNQTPPALPDRTEQAVLEAVTWLESHFDREFNLAALSSRVHLSPAHLSRSFTRRMGIGAVDFVHRLRCEEACRLLHWSNKPISEIASKVGYNELAYFSRRFRRHIGQSPSRYRKAHLDAELPRRKTNTASRQVSHQ